MIKEIMSLQFFAKRIGVSIRRLNWAIIRAKNEDGEENESPAVSIKGSPLAFNILNDNVETVVNIGGCKTVVLEARVSENSNGYEFKALNGERLEVTFEEIQKVYENKVYSKELEAKARRFA